MTIRARETFDLVPDCGHILNLTKRFISLEKRNIVMHWNGFG